MKITVGTPKKINTYFVFQNKTFDYEYKGEYLWAPQYSNNMSTPPHHWHRMKEIKKGDIIFHGCQGEIKAISVAMGSWSDCSQPLELVKNGLWLKEGFKVDCKYIIMRFPIKTKNFKDQIIKYSTEQYAPFNKNGTGNQGYLFDLNQNLAKIFLEALVDNNPYLKSSDYFMKFLEQ